MMENAVWSVLPLEVQLLVLAAVRGQTHAARVCAVSKQWAWMFFHTRRKVTFDHSTPRASPSCIPILCAMARGVERLSLAGWNPRVLSAPVLPWDLSVREAIDYVLMQQMPATSGGIASSMNQGVVSLGRYTLANGEKVTCVLNPEIEVVPSIEELRRRYEALVR